MILNTTIVIMIIIKIALPMAVTIIIAASEYCSETTYFDSK